MKKSTITIDIELDENNVPETIQWEAPELGKKSECKAMILSVWDKAEANTMRIDLWTKEMQVEEMTFFVHQTLLTLSDRQQAMLAWLQPCAISAITMRKK